MPRGDTHGTGHTRQGGGIGDSSPEGNGDGVNGGWGGGGALGEGVLGEPVLGEVLGTGQGGWRMCGEGIGDSSGGGGRDWGQLQGEQLSGAACAGGAGDSPGGGGRVRGSRAPPRGERWQVGRGCCHPLGGGCEHPGCALHPLPEGCSGICLSPLISAPAVWGRPAGTCLPGPELGGSWGGTGQAKGIRPVHSGQGEHRPAARLLQGKFM